MPRTFTLLALLSAAASLVAAVACSSSSSSGAGGSGSCNVGGADGGTCTAGQTPAYTSCLTSADLQKPVVSFAKDIQPTLNTSCGLAGSTCHGSANNPAVGQVFLGSPDGGVDAAQVLAAIVNQASPENPAMDIVKAGDPGKSLLMHKLDFDQCQFASQCAQAAMANPLFDGCGSGMPLNSGTLDLATRDNFRRWIAQGAQNN